MPHQIILKVDKSTKVILILIAVLLGVLIIKPYLSKEAVAQYDSVVANFQIAPAGEPGKERAWLVNTRIGKVYLLEMGSLRSKLGYNNIRFLAKGIIPD